MSLEERDQELLLRGVDPPIKERAEDGSVDDATAERQLELVVEVINTTIAYNKERESEDSYSPSASVIARARELLTQPAVEAGLREQLAHSLIRSPEFPNRSTVAELMDRLAERLKIEQAQALRRRVIAEAAAVRERNGPGDRQRALRLGLKATEAQYVPLEEQEKWLRNLRDDPYLKHPRSDSSPWWDPK
jgi:hypothetical protein